MTGIDDDEPRPVVLERRATPRGELVLRQAGGHYEVIANGTFLMDTRDGRSERALVREALAGRAGARVLIGGLGVGFSLAEALAHDVAEVVVAEIEPAVVLWAGTELRAANGGALDDPRVRLVVDDVLRVLRDEPGRFDAICLDTDNGPGWLVRHANAGIYADEGVAAAASRLAGDGRLAVWSAAADGAYEARLRRRFADVRAVRVPARRGPDDVIYVACSAVRPER